MNTDQIVALFVESDPVGDQDRVELPFNTGDEYLMEILEGPASRAREEVAAPKLGRRWHGPAIAAVVFLLVAAIGIGLTLLTSSNPPPVAPTVPSSTSTTSTTTSTLPPADTAQAEFELGQGFAAAWNARRFDDVSKLFLDGEVTIQLLNPETPENVLEWTSEEIAQDLAFAAVLEDNWELVECSREFGRAQCRYLASDVFSDRIQLDPVLVTFFFTEVDGAWTDVSTNMVSVFGSYHDSMQEYGRWHAANYPEEGPIAIDTVGRGGDPPRAWNYPDVTAADRIRTHLDEWISSPGFTPGE